jgi:hypothetical protein
LKQKRSMRDVVRETADVLSKVGVDYVIVGGVAVSAWGNIRTTVDLDIIMSIRKEDAARLADAFTKSDFSINERDILAALREKSHFTIFDNHSQYRIDSKGAYGDRELETIRTRKTIQLGTVQCFIASPENTIANKLLFGSEQDILDAEGIYARQKKTLDIDALRRACRKLGVMRELANLEKRVKKSIGE